MITLDEATHTYSDGTGAKLISVSSVLKRVLVKSWADVDPAVIENARERGVRVERYATEILRDGGCTIDHDERQDVQDRVAGFYAWYEATKPVFIDTQIRVSADGVAGTLDFVLNINAMIHIVDLKCTASPEADWPIQVGSYSEMYPQCHTGTAVLHINPKFAKGYIWRPYDPETVRGQWRAALAWYRVLEALKVKEAA